jgi:hypothetical protein
VQIGRAKFFLPRGMPGGGYTQAQLNHIERHCDCCGLDLFPIDSFYS